MAKKTKHNPNEATLDMGFDEMDAASQQETGPVTVLGMTFPNDEERRTYFREQLRAKLPELRSIEGFPIGSDDDIVNLSDPPYYTACPNPWLNDFIAEWEQEKLQLEAEGKRHPNVVVNEPYAADVSEGKSNPVYTAHTYHTKVPHPAIMRYILNYTQPGDIVLDGFAGTGMTGVAALCCKNDCDSIAERINNEWRQNSGHLPIWGKRHAICGDLSPYASNISYLYNSSINVSLLEKEILRISNEMQTEYGWMYTTTDSNGNPNASINFIVWSEIFTCPQCGEEFSFWEQAVSHDTKSMLDTFECPHCKALLNKKSCTPTLESYFDPVLQSVQQRVKKKPAVIVAKSAKEKIQRPANEYDLNLIERIENSEIPFAIPTYLLPEGQETQRNVDRGIVYAHQFYTKRNLIALSALHDKIAKSPYASALYFLFTAITTWVANTNRFHTQHYFNGGGGWSVGVLPNTLYVPALPIETSILGMLYNKLPSIKNALNSISADSNNLCYVGSASSIPLASNSIDYIFTDPPFGKNIYYSELNTLPEPWLGVITNNHKEAIENPTQGKSTETYRSIMYECFSEYLRVLKPGKWLTVEFSNTSAAVWNAIQTALQQAGFIIANVSALDKKQGSFNAVTTTTAVKQDLIISCFKPTEQLLYKFENEASETNVWDFIDELLSRLPVHLEHGNKTTTVVERSPKILYDRLISFYVQHGFPVPLNAQEFQAGLRERYAERDGMYFTPSQAAKYDELRKRTDGFQASLFFVDSEQGGIAWLNNELSTPQTYQDLQPKWMQAINGVRKGDILPELMQILEENFIKESDGKWRKPNLQDDVDLAALRHKALMREFKVYVEVAQKPRGKIKEARVEALRAGFKQCYQDKDFATIVAVGDRIPQNLLTEDEQLLQFYEIASSRV